MSTFDIIFVGAGAAGCVAAGRLASANPDLRILILEAGPHSLNIESHVQPLAFLSNLGIAEKKKKSFSEHFAQTASVQPVPVLAGQVVGGGSSVNFMSYSRASASDYDDWENIHENRGWGSKDLIPLLKDVESYGPKSFNSTHGYDGPIQVSFPKDHVELAHQCLDVAKSYDKERTVLEDINDFEHANGYDLWAKYISGKTGRRSDAAHHFIYNQSDNKNLVVLAESRVVRVLFEGTQAIGVEYVTQTDVQPTPAFASKLVVLSAGPFGSAPILERSGIGAQEVLEEHGVSQLVDLPGVGSNFRDHNATFSQYIASPEAETYDHIFQEYMTDIQRSESGDSKERRDLNKNPFPNNGVDVFFKLRPSSADVQKLGPAFEKRWKEFFVPSPDKPLVLGGLRGFDPRFSTLSPAGKYFSLIAFLGYPTSVGTIHITHGLNPNSPLDFQYSYGGSDADVATHRWAYKHLRELARRMPFYRGDFINNHPAFPMGSNVACKLDGTPVAIDAPDLVYTAEDDIAIDEHHRRTAGTSWHSMGACAMKPKEKGGVVDSRLNVYGTTQLKVADMSICPGNVGANTYNTALAIGAKAAVLIAEDLGLKL